MTNQSNNTVIVTNTIVEVAGKGFGKVTGYTKGWYTIEIKGEEVKARAKDVTEHTPEETEIRLHPDHTRYTRHADSKTASGRARYDTSDEIANAFRCVDQSQMYALAVTILAEYEIEATIDGLYSKYSHLNNGMQRMNLGNKCRGAQRQYAKKQEEQAALLAIIDMIENAEEVTPSIEQTA